MKLLLHLIGKRLIIPWFNCFFTAKFFNFFWLLFIIFGLMSDQQWILFSFHMQSEVLSFEFDNVFLLCCD